MNWTNCSRFLDQKFESFIIDLIHLQLDKHNEFNNSHKKLQFSSETRNHTQVLGIFWANFLPTFEVGLLTEFNFSKARQACCWERCKTPNEQWKEESWRLMFELLQWTHVQGLFIENHDLKQCETNYFDITLKTFQNLTYFSSAVIWMRSWYEY